MRQLLNWTSFELFGFIPLAYVPRHVSASEGIPEMSVSIHRTRPFWHRLIQ